MRQDINYRICGDGPLLEALSFTIHDLDLSDCCELIRNTKNYKKVTFPDVILLPAVSPDYKFNLHDKTFKTAHWVITSFIIENITTEKYESLTLISRWDPNSIADQIISLYKRGNF